MNLQGRTVLITGGGTGIGRATALRLAQEGARIVINYARSAREAEQTGLDIEASGGSALVVQADVADRRQVEEMVAQIVAHYGTIDVVINNAGTTDFVALDDLAGMLDEYWDRAFNVNVKGMFHVSRACAEALKQQRGTIINITSIAGMTGQGSSIAYAASKAAAISVTKSLALALAPEVRVNAIAPGIVRTRWVAGKEDHVQRLSEGTPLGRTAEAEDVADMIYGLLIGGDFVTGQTIVVDGGFTNTL